MACTKSSARVPMPTPSFIQWHSDCGPVLRYDRLTAAQVQALDIQPDDDQTGHSWTPGVGIRRTRGNRFNVRLTAEVIAVGNTEYAKFRERLMKSIMKGAC